MKKSSVIVVEVLIVLVGLVLIYFSFGYINSKSSTWTPVIAQIVSFKEGNTDAEGSATYDVTFEYEVNGVKYTGYESVSNPPAVGDKLKVFYNPAEPADTVPSLGEREWMGLGGLGLGLACIVGVIWWIVRPKLFN